MPVPSQFNKSWGNTPIISRFATLVKLTIQQLSHTIGFKNKSKQNEVCIQKRFKTFQIDKVASPSPKTVLYYDGRPQLFR